jgi:hypothetical protein
VSIIKLAQEHQYSTKTIQIHKNGTPSKHNNNNNNNNNNEKGTLMLRDVAISGDRNVIKKRSREDFKI